MRVSRLPPIYAEFRITIRFQDTKISETVTPVNCKTFLVFSYYDWSTIRFSGMEISLAAYGTICFSP